MYIYLSFLTQLSNLEYNGHLQLSAIVNCAVINRGTQMSSLNSALGTLGRGHWIYGISILNLLGCLHAIFHRG